MGSGGGGEKRRREGTRGKESRMLSCRAEEEGLWEAQGTPENSSNFCCLGYYSLTRDPLEAVAPARLVPGSNGTSQSPGTAL